MNRVRRGLRAAAAALVALACLGAVAAAQTRMADTSTTDNAARGSASHDSANDRYCHQGGAARLVLIDITTPYDDADKLVIEAMLRGVFAAVKGGDRITVRTIADSYTRSERLIERCAPYCAAEGVAARLLGCNDGVIRADRDTVQQEILATLRKRLSHFAELKHSDILRTIDAAAREDYRPPGPVHLYIYSDLLENSELLARPALFGFTAPAPALTNLQKMRLIPLLRDAEIRVAGVGRSDAPDRRPLGVRYLNGLRGFWTAYFQAAGARHVSIGLGITRD